MMSLPTDPTFLVPKHYKHLQYEQRMNTATKKPNKKCKSQSIILGFEGILPSFLSGMMHKLIQSFRKL